MFFRMLIASVDRNAAIAAYILVMETTTELIELRRQRLWRSFVLRDACVAGASRAHTARLLVDDERSSAREKSTKVKQMNEVPCAVHTVTAKRTARWLLSV